MPLNLRTLHSLSDMPSTIWDAQCDTAKHPFLSHAFLSALEESGSAVAKTGWQPSHLVLEENGQIVAVAPCYVKSHSQGEYVFDHGWANAFQNAGGSYYPKLQMSVPFTPVTGPRLLAPTQEHKKALADGVIALCENNGISSVHMTFAGSDETRLLKEPAWLLRQDIQFHWQNDGYTSFEDFLQHLSSAKRKNLRKERKTISDLGITFEHLTGRALTEAHWDHFFTFYMDTGSRKWGRPYLTRKFFSLIGERMPSAIVLIMAKRAGRYIAGALNFRGTETLFGRNWGCIENHPCLHFETCYYQAQDFAIAHGLKTIEAGAQGEHKLARGYVPVVTESLHYLSHPGLRRAVADYLESERQAIRTDSAVLAEHAPFRHEPD
jgi:uncharacterized protein